MTKMTKTSITATFANGETITRKTTMKLTHAWRAIGHDSDGVTRSTTGFSGSESKAHRAAAAELRYFPHNPTAIEVIPVTILTAEDEKKAKADKPFMVQRQYADGRKYKLTGRGNKVLRFATRAEADAAADAERTRRGPRNDVQVTVIGNPPMLRRK